MYYNPNDFQNNQIILPKGHITSVNNNVRFPYISPKPKQNYQMDTQLPHDTKFELAYAGIQDP